MSGRTDDGKSKTEAWLNKHKVKYQHIYMRAAADMRKDSVVKQELFERFVRDKYNISLVLDDRQQVARIGVNATTERRLSLPKARHWSYSRSLQVGEGDF